MNRRRFVHNSLLGITGLPASGASLKEFGKKLATEVDEPISPGSKEATRPIREGTHKIFVSKDPTLFPTDVPEKQWVRFTAEGFSEPACGVIYHLDHPRWLTRHKKRPNGMPLGGVGTGCIDLEKNGTLGFMTVFNSHVPRRGPLDLPFLGLSLGGKTWILADLDNRHVSSIGWETVYYFAPHPESGTRTGEWNPQDYAAHLDWQVRGVNQIYYWGHYPVADLEFELTELTTRDRTDGVGYRGGRKVKAPVSIGLRAWSPFIPGDVEASMIPGAVFEARLHNVSDSVQSGTLAFSFPGPSLEESEGATAFSRHTVTGSFSGISVTNGSKIGYALGVVGERVRTGGELGTHGQGWAHISTALPPTVVGQSGSSVAVDFTLKPGEQKKVHFVLSWYSPHWKGGGTLAAGGRTYTHMYTTRYHDAVEVAKLLAEQHERLLARVLSWQQAVYGKSEIPVWLRESLVNILHLITENALWAVAEPPIGSWCRKEDGLLGMIGNPRDCPLMEAITEAFYGNFPLVYFFPRIALSTLRGYRAYQNSDGSIPFAFSRTPTVELAHDYSQQYQSSTNGVIYADLVDRYWQLTGDDGFLHEFYPSVKKNLIFTMQLNSGPDGVISAPTGNMNRGVGFVRPETPGKGLKFGGEHNGTFGMSSHLGGLHLAQLRFVERMAEKMGDQEFVAQCREWIRQGTSSLESKMWADRSYLNYWDPETRKKSALVYAYQLAGEWAARLHGVPGVFRPERVKVTLETIERINMALTDFGAVMFADPQGTPTGKNAFDVAKDSAYGSASMFVSENLILAMTYIYLGSTEVGLELAHKHWKSIVCEQELTWEQPNLLRGDSGEATFGWDYYQNMLLWALPLALAGQDLAGVTRAGSLVDRVLRASERS